MINHSKDIFHFFEHSMFEQFVKHPTTSSSSWLVIDTLEELLMFYSDNKVSVPVYFVFDFEDFEANFDL